MSNGVAALLTCAVVLDQLNFAKGVYFEADEGNEEKCQVSWVDK